MKTFMALYMAPVGAMDEMSKNMTPETSRLQNESWKEWMDQKETSLADVGAPLGRNKRVTASGVADVRNEVGGYSIVEADSHDQAASLFLDNPMLQMPGAYVEVLEIKPMPEM
jgi:hypothetical protein